MKHFLIIDDDETFASVLARSIIRRGHLAQVAFDGDRSLALLRDQAADNEITHAVLDLKLAESSGLQFLPQLLALRPQLQVVVLTGYASVATTVQAIKQGAINYLSKPATVEEILAAFEHDTSQVHTPVPAKQNVEDAGLEDTALTIQRVEWEYIQRQLLANNNNIAATARALGMHRRTLQRKLQKRPGKL
jgi:two-component system response regulator RegA